MIIDFSTRGRLRPRAGVRARRENSDSLHCCGRGSLGLRAVADERDHGRPLPFRGRSRLERHAGPQFDCLQEDDLARVHGRHVSDAETAIRRVGTSRRSRSADSRRSGRYHPGDLRNQASRPYSVHPHGVFYTKENEGAPYVDGTTNASKADDAVAPGSSYTYLWEVPEQAGPADGDVSSVLWPYHSHVDEGRDVNSGLIGPMIITRRGVARDDGSPQDVDREFIAMFALFDEHGADKLNKKPGHTAARMEDSEQVE